MKMSVLRPNSKNKLSSLTEWKSYVGLSKSAAISAQSQSIGSGLF